MPRATCASDGPLSKRTSRFAVGPAPAFYLLIGLFVVSRVAMGYLAVDRPHYEGQTYITGDVTVYRSWANTVEQGGGAYTEAKVQYPPGSLPFILAPGIGSPDKHSYLVRFVVMMAAVDLLGFVALYFLARRHGSSAGMWVWAVALPALGPILFDRIDLPPAAATMWGLLAADSGAWLAAGAWFGFAAAAKLYPVLLLPELVAFARSRWKVVAGFAALIAVALLPFAGDLAALSASVLGYHSARGIQVESDWGLALLFAAHFGYHVSVVYDFGSFNVVTVVSDELKRLAEGASVLATALGTLIAWGKRRSGAGVMAGLMFGMLALVMTTGTVLSPQYLVWLAALGSVAVTLDRRFLLPVLLLVPMGALTQEVYPFFYADLLRAHLGQLVILAVRNGLLVTAAAWAIGLSILAQRNPLR